VSVTAAKGFVAAGVACGIKSSGASDLAVVATADHRAVTAAGVFTSNLACAAPVQISRQHLEDGTAAAVVLSSGNANAATGEQGRLDALRMCELAAEGLGCDAADVLVCSTGLIGIPLPMAPIEAGAPNAVASLADDAAAGQAAADAILTTDTVRKEATATASLPDGVTVTAGGMAKGAAMLAPSLATMLAVVTTDAAIDSTALDRSLQQAVDASFNATLIDGCTSTNDTVIVLANGDAGNEPIVDGDALEAFTAALTEVCVSLADAMAADAEGATKFAKVEVRGAPSSSDARIAARAVAGSQLVQCSLYGSDPYWGRVLSELGASGVIFDPESTDISYNGVLVCQNGIAAEHDAAALAASMKERNIEIVCDLHAGPGEAKVRFTDLTHAYVDENMGTS
jgi:glutamate N-acetyltransferase/amino-acid N-acetyltransferase